MLLLKNIGRGSYVLHIPLGEIFQVLFSGGNVAMKINNSDLFSSIEEVLPGIMENLRDGCIYDGFCDIMGKRICWSSNNLEGNTLSLEETVELIDFDAVRSDHTYTEYREAMNLFGAIQEFLFPMQVREISSDYLKGVNHAITGLREGFRKKQVYIGTFTEAVYYPPKPEDIGSLMGELTAHANEPKNGVSDIVRFVALFHINFERIHPFLDGNGRTGRMVLNQHLVNYGMLPVSIEKNSDYRQAFRLYERNRDTTKMEGVIAKAELRAIEVVRQLVGDRDDGGKTDSILKDISTF